MIKFSSVIILILSYESCCCYHESLSSDWILNKWMSNVSTAMIDIANEFFQNGSNFVVLTHTGYVHNIWDMTAKLPMSKKLDTFSQSIFAVHPSSFEELKIRDQGFLLFRTFKDFTYFESEVYFETYNYGQKAFLILIEELSAENFLDFFMKMNVEELTIFSYGLIVNGIFIIIEDKFVTLITLEWFGEGKCNSLHINVINKFDISTSNWSKKLTKIEKFLDFHECELVLMLPLLGNQVNPHLSGSLMFNQNQTELIPTGIIPQIFTIASKYHKFIPAYQPALIKLSFMSHYDKDSAFLITFNNTKKIPHVYMTTKVLKTVYHVSISNAFASTNIYILITPAEVYSQYEKMALPFDLETWIFLLVTFVVTIVTISVVNRLSQSARNTVYGEGIYNPFWNAVSIFFGISQTRLPAANFPRFILVLFIWFCLIFRTCFQSKLFEFMTGDPRHDPPKTYDEVLNQGYFLFMIRINGESVINVHIDQR